MEWNGVVDYWSGLLDWTRLLKCHAHKYAMCSLNQSQSTTLPPRLCLTMEGLENYVRVYMLYIDYVKVYWKRETVV